MHGERMNRRFFYEAPHRWRRFGPTDIVGFDNNGLPVANRIVGYTFQPADAAVNPLLMGSPDLSNAPQIMGHFWGQRARPWASRCSRTSKTLVNAGISVSSGGMVALAHDAAHISDPGGPAQDPGRAKSGDFAGAIAGGCRGARSLQQRRQRRK